MQSSVTTLRDHVTRRLSQEFSRVLGELLPLDQLFTLLQAYPAYPTHDTSSAPVTSASLAMTKAFESVIGRLPRLASPADEALWKATWADARARILEAHSCSHASARAPVPASFAGVPITWDFEQLQSRHPTAFVWNMGQGSLAVRLDCSQQSYVLITDCEGGPPRTGALTVSITRYARNGDQVYEADVVAVAVLELFIEEALQSASCPRTVGDYFVQRLGAGELDPSLRDLPMNSTWGQDCTRVIDSASALAGHCRASDGEDGVRLETRVIELARQMTLQIARRRSGDPGC